MKIQDKAFVAIDYSLSLDSGEEVDKSDPGKPLGFIFNTGQVIPGLEEQLNGKEVGWTNKFTVETEEGYGAPRAELFREVQRDRFPADIDLQPGMAFQAEGPHGDIPFRVKSVEDEVVTIDLNHPLCGERLHFTVKVVEVRKATTEELDALSSKCDEETCSGCGEIC